jgi:hypothetical protein
MASDVTTVKVDYNKLVDELIEGVKTCEASKPWKDWVAFVKNATEGAPCSACEPILGDDPRGLYALQVAYAKSIGYQVNSKKQDLYTYGTTDETDKKIEIDPNQSPAAQVSCLFHELGHALTHEVWSPPSDAVIENMSPDDVMNLMMHEFGILSGDWEEEVRCEAIAWIATKALGIDSSAYALPYLLLQGEDGGEGDVTGAHGAVIKSITEQKDVIISTVQKILGAPMFEMVLA